MEEEDKEISFAPSLPRSKIKGKKKKEITNNGLHAAGWIIQSVKLTSIIAVDCTDGEKNDKGK